MAIKVKEITLWRIEIDNRPGAMARTLGPLADAGANLRVVMGYRYPGEESKAAVEIYPVTGAKLTAAAKKIGLQPAEFPALIVDGDDRAGLGHRFARGIAEAGINMSFLVAQVVGRKYSAVIGFESKEDARKAAAVVKKAAKR